MGQTLKPRRVSVRSVLEGSSTELPVGLPASAQRVHRVLFDEGPLTHRELVELSGLPARTVRFAVARLRDAGVLGVRSNLMDSRQQYFFVPRA